MKSRFYQDFYRIFLLLFLVIFGVLLSLYVLASRSITQANRQNIAQTADMLLEKLGENIELMEAECYTLSTRVEIQDFLQEGNLPTRHAMAEAVYQLLEDHHLTDHPFSIVALDETGWYYRFSGSISTTECQRLALLLAEETQVSHLSLSLGGTPYIGYATALYDENGLPLGKLCILEHGEHFLEYSYGSVEDYAVSVAVLSGDTVVSTHGTLPEGGAELYVVNHVGLTPFRVAAWLNPDYQDPVSLYFLVAIFLAALTVLVAFLLVARQQRRRFFSPLNQMIQSVEDMDATTANRLPKVGTPELDGLITKVNSLLFRLEVQNREVGDTRVTVERVKTERQEAINLALKKQMNAHFIVNTLSTIQMLIKYGEQEKSDQAISDLSAMLHYIFNANDTIPLWDELSYLTKYVNLMNLRYGNKLHLELEAEDKLMDVPIPRMMLQPLLENGIFYGYAKKTSNCALQVRASTQEGRILLEVQDWGSGLSRSQLELFNAPCQPEGGRQGMESLSGMAIPNLKRRLYGDMPEAKFQAISQGGTTITLSWNIK